MAAFGVAFDRWITGPEGLAPARLVRDAFTELKAVASGGGL
ncbi:hypothetical protein AB9128_31065 [Streptomyces cinereoruber]